MLDPEARAAWLTLLPHLAPGADAGPAIAFFRESEAECLGEIVAVPGHEGVRAGLLRLLPAVVPDEAARADLLSRAEHALHTLTEGEGDGGDGIRRPPAWAGLGLLELLDQRGSAAAIEQAFTLARSGFVRGAGVLPRGDGEVLWAMAEVAAEVGWTDRSGPLLEAACAARFADPDNLGRVLLVRALDELEGGATSSPSLDRLLDLDDLDDRTRVHAAWIAAHLDRTAGRMAAALDRLHEALEHVDVDEEPEVADRIRSAMAAWGGDRAEPGEA